MLWLKFGHDDWRGSTAGIDTKLLGWSSVIAFVAATFVAAAPAASRRNTARDHKPLVFGTHGGGDRTRISSAGG